MLGIDLALLVGVAVVVVAAASVIGGRSLGDRLEKRRREAQGKRNAEDERRRLDETCAACGEPIDPAVDLFDREARSSGGRGQRPAQWWHRRCWRESVD